MTKNKNSFKKLRINKYGISLIVLVITIIVIIILAAAVILTLNKNNPIEEANKARYESDVANIQAIFTNTVAKVMAKNQGIINIEAGALNTTKKGGSSVEGGAIYKVVDSTNNSNKNGTIVFSIGNNNETTYYTGKMLPLYQAGETTWYVDSEGIISLQVGEEKYGNGIITDQFKNPVLGN